MSNRIMIGLTLIFSAVAFTGCRTTKPGTHVEVVEKGGSRVYVAGAAGPGISRTMACAAAVNRAAGAISLRFAQDNDDIGDDIADELGASDGEVFLQRYARHQSAHATVPNLQFDPIEHICMATVRWQPPVFIKDAVTKFARDMKARETGEASTTPAASTTTAAPAAPAGTAPASAPPAAPVAVAPVAPPPPPAASVAPAPAVVTPVSQCRKELSRLERTLQKSQKQLDQLEECKRRTDGDETICHGYVLKLEKAQKYELGDEASLVKCMNVSLASNLRRALTDAIPGHAAVSVESRSDGSVILWAYAPARKTAWAIEVTPAGRAGKKTALAPNQLTWLRQQLGL